MRTIHPKLAVYDFLGLGGFLVPLGGLILPGVFFWLQRDPPVEERNHFRSVMNFQFSIQIYSFLLVLLLPWQIALAGWSILMLASFMIIAHIGYRALKGEMIKYPFSLPLFPALESPPSYEEMLYDYEQARTQETRQRKLG